MLHPAAASLTGSGEAEQAQPKPEASKTTTIRMRMNTVSPLLLLIPLVAITSFFMTFWNMSLSRKITTNSDQQQFDFSNEMSFLLSGLLSATLNSSSIQEDNIPRIDPFLPPKEGDSPAISSTISESASTKEKSRNNNALQQVVQSLRDQHSFPEKGNRRLEFVHIPKTAGTAVETTAARHNVSWGVCHFLNRKRSQEVSHNHTLCPDAKETFYKKPKLIYSVPHWHLPPRYFTMKDRYEYNPYEDADLFTIVRNPYERILSQYYYVTTELAKFNNNSRIYDKANDVSYLNGWMRRQLLPMNEKATAGVQIGRYPNRKNNESSVKLGNGPYYFYIGHLIPQYDYVYDGYGDRIIAHVLHMESLDKEFPLLMKEYNLSEIVLPTKKIRTSEKKLGLANLTLENIRAIERYYGRDFAAFGYETISQYLENQYSSNIQWF